MRPGRTSILSRSEPVSSSELLVILPCATPAILALIVAHTASKCNKIKGLAEREGFEPPIRFPVYTLSKRAPSAARPSLRHTDSVLILWGLRGDRNRQSASATGYAAESWQLTLNLRNSLWILSNGCDAGRTSVSG